jgi:ABC-type lipoprotein release transport system permease subunit
MRTSTFHPVTFAAMLLLLTALAGHLPVHRASRIDSMAALRIS